MKSAEIRRQFLEFFQSKEHTLVSSASLLPQSTGLLFTNAGMNPFVPYFLGTEPIPYQPPRAVATQKCIRAGGKHNDLEEVGQDSYHHTFFEMLGNWSFGDYFKQQAIDWAWELFVDRWKVPPQRLYATVYCPKAGDPGVFDQEVYDHWKRHFEKQGLDPAVHIVRGDVKDNFWMMGDTGPCGPCSELHLDLTPAGDTKGKLVNADSDHCIELWNLVFIEYNADGKGGVSKLPAKHVDTGMGFERICSIIQVTDGFKNFNQRFSNYNTDLFWPFFKQLEQLSGKSYRDIYEVDFTGDISADTREALETATAFRVIADHVRALGCSVADGILPGNTGRNYVLRRIVRRALRYGKILQMEAGWLPKLVSPLIDTLGEAFPELRQKNKQIREALANEEKSFRHLLEAGLKRFEDETRLLKTNTLTGDVAFRLYDTYGFPVDLTALLCRERNIILDEKGFEQAMQKQKKQARLAQKREGVVALDFQSHCQTKFVGFETLQVNAQVVEVFQRESLTFLIVDQTPFYAEMGGQVADKGQIQVEGELLPIIAIQQVGLARAHVLKGDFTHLLGKTVELQVEASFRQQIASHHTATHLLHKALHQLVSKEATQQGSLVANNRLRFDFISFALDADKVRAIETQVNQWIKEDHLVSWLEISCDQVKDRADITQFFGDNYGSQVRVVQIGGDSKKLNGFSMELCGGTHIKRTSDLGEFRIKSETGIANGVRRIEAVCGQALSDWEQEQKQLLVQNFASLAQKSQQLQTNLEKLGEKNSKIVDAIGSLKKVQSLKSSNLTKQTIKHLREEIGRLKKTYIKAEQLLKKEQASAGQALIEEALAPYLTLGDSFVLQSEGEAFLLQAGFNQLKSAQFSQTAILIISDNKKIHLGVFMSRASQQENSANDLFAELIALIDGKGGGNEEVARGTGINNEAKLESLINFSQSYLGLDKT